MKYNKIIRLLGMIVLLSLLISFLPSSALAATTLVLSPTQARVGDEIDYTISGYGISATDYYIDIYISDQYVTAGTMNVTVTRYKRLRWGDGPLDDGDGYSGYFDIPATINEGVLGETTPHTVTAGSTYYIYATVRYTYAQADNPPKLISTATSLNIAPGASLNPLQPATGPVGTTVTVSGVNFPSGNIAITLDGVSANITGGSTQISGGSFISNIIIPAGTTAGDHTITVTVGSSSASKTFTVTAPASISVSPTSGAAGSQISISGNNFPTGTIAITFNGTSAPITGGTTQTSGGAFASFITVPSSASTGTHTITATAGGISVNTYFTVTGTAPTPTLNPLSATSGVVGSSITVSGSDFPDGNIAISFNGTVLSPQSGSTQTSNGNFSSIITIPSDATAGTHTITVTVGSTTKSTSFTVTPGTTPPPSNAVLNIDQSGHNIGATIGISGAGFNPNTNITIKYDDKQITTITSSTQGTFITTFNAPASEAGDHVITVTDGTNSADATFTVESTAPKVPTPLKPELGAKIKSPMIFDWDEVTDESQPVTYQLQIATDKSFGLGSVVLDKTSIEGSSYTLSEIEEDKLTTQETPYYWRIKAVDAASNESEWTGAGGFYVAGPFKFPTWAIYVAAIGGAIVFFLLGLWVGRRTAFYY